jgi:nicotinamidase-related amidase
VRDPRDDAYARLIVERSVGVQPGWQVAVRATPLARPLVEALVEEIARRGAYPKIDRRPVRAYRAGRAAARAVADSASHLGGVRRLHQRVGARREVEGARFVFERGRIVVATAATGEDFLREPLDTDDGARRLGELGIGCNPGIQRYMKNVGFDEKIDGTVHLAVGNAYSFTGGTNASAVHWDIVKDLRRNGRLYADDRRSRRTGRGCWTGRRPRDPAADAARPPARARNPAIGTDAAQIRSVPRATVALRAARRAPAEPTPPSGGWGVCGWGRARELLRRQRRPPRCEDRAVSLLDREDTVVVVVDVQPAFLARDWFSDDDVATSGAALDRMVWLVALAARLGIPIVVTEEEPERNGSTDTRVAQRLPASTPVLRKPTFGLARTPDILAAVRATERRTAVVVGCETDVCVAQSAIGLFEHGFESVVIADATFSPGEMHARGLDRLAAAGVGRNHAKGVTYEWLASVEDAHVVLSDPGLPRPPFRL